MPNYTRLTGAGDLTKDNVTTMIEQNVVEFFKYAFLEAGGFSNVPVVTPGTTSPYDISRLYPVQADGATNGTIWQAQKADWCYESGLDSAYQPFVADGVYVDGVFYESSQKPSDFVGSASYGNAMFAGTDTPDNHYIDFPNGRVIFANFLPLDSVVQASYAYRWVSIFDQSVPWFKDVVLDGFYTQQANTGGVLAVLNNYRVQTPLVVVEASMRQDMTPVQLGDLAHWVHQTVLFHVITEDKLMRDRIVNAIVQQQDSTIYLYDINARRESGDVPLDWRGTPTLGARSYPDVVKPPPAGFRWREMYFEKMVGQDVSAAFPMFRGTVRGTLTTYFSSI